MLLLPWGYKERHCRCDAILVLSRFREAVTMIVDIGNSGTQKMSLAARFKALRETKTYDLLAATPLIVWYGVALAVRLPELKSRIITTNWSTADVAAISDVGSKIVSLIFITVLIAVMVLRQPPRVRTLGLIPRIAAVAGTFLGVGIALLPPAELSFLA